MSDTLLAAALVGSSLLFFGFLFGYLWGWVDGNNRRKTVEGSASYVPYKDAEYKVDGYIRVYDKKKVWGE